MTRQWVRMTVETSCGYCRQRRIAQGAYALVITLRGVRRPRIRCQDCAGDAPPDLPIDNPPPQPRTKKMTAISAAVPKYLTRVRTGK